MIRKIWLTSLLFLISAVTVAQESFVVSDVNVKGLQRISAGAVFNLLPVKVGDTFSPSQTPELIRSLYKSGFFKNIELKSEGSVLVIEVVEYPSIAVIEFAGNKLIKDDSLRGALAENDFIEGSVFQPDVLDQIKQELKRQYLNQGKYNNEQILPEAWIDYSTTVNPVSENGCYGAHIWLNSDGNYFKNSPHETYFFSGFQGQYVCMIPSKKLVIVRLGLAGYPDFVMDELISSVVGSIK